MKRVKKNRGAGKSAHHYTKKVRLDLCKNKLLVQVDLLVQTVCRWSLCVLPHRIIRKLEHMFRDLTFLYLSVQDRYRTLKE